MSTVIDSYAVSNQNVLNAVYSAVSKWGQSVTGDGKAVGWIEFFVKSNGSASGNMYAKIYAHSGTFGTSSVPTGAALATSEPVDYNVLTSTLSSIRFKFLTPYTLVNGTKYCIAFEFAGGDATHYANIGYDNSSPSHGGNAWYYTTGYTAYPAGDTCFIMHSSTATAAVWSAHTIQDNLEHSVIVSGKVYVPALKQVGAAGSGGLYIFDLATGAQDQLYATASYLAGAPVVSGGYAFIYDRFNKTLKRVRLNDGTVTHTVSSIGGMDIETIGWDVANSRIIVPIGAALKAYNMADLSEAWSFTLTTGNTVQGSAPLVVGDYCYFKAQNATVLYKLNLSDGTEADSATGLGAEGSTYSYASPIYDPDHDYIYVHGTAAQIHCIQVSDMSVVWSTTVGSGMTTPNIHNSIGYHNNQVFVPCRDDSAGYKAKLYALAYDDGVEAWANTSAWDDVEDYTTMLLTANKIIIPGVTYADLYNAKLYIIRQSDGGLVSSQALAFSAACGGVAAASGGRVIVDELDGIIECFDLGGGTSDDSEHYMKNVYHNGFSGSRLGDEYSLSLGAGSFSEAGTATPLLYNRAVIPGAGSYTLTGMAAALRYARIMAALAAAPPVILTGSDAALLRLAMLLAGVNSYTLTGQDADLVFTEAPNRVLDAESGSFIITGSPAWVGRILPDLVAGPDSIVLAGTDAILQAARILQALGTTVTELGADVDFLKTKLFSVASGDFALTGKDVMFIYNSRGNPFLYVRPGVSRPSLAEGDFEYSPMASTKLDPGSDESFFYKKI